MSMTQQDWEDAYDIYDHCMATGVNTSTCEHNTQQSYPDFYNGGGGSSFGNSMSNYWGNPSNWIDFTSGLAGLTGDIIGMANNQQGYAYNPTLQAERENTMWFVVGGIGILLLIVILFLIFKK